MNGGVRGFGLAPLVASTDPQPPMPPLSPHPLLLCTLCLALLAGCDAGADGARGAVEADTARIAQPGAAGTLPRLANPEAIRERLRETYPEPLRDRGIGGEVRLRILISAEGLPTAVELDGSSGQPALDEASLRVAEEMRFEPARDAAGRAVPVWTSFPIEWRAADEG